MKKHVFVIASLLFALAMAVAQVPANSPDQSQPGVSTPRTPPTFPPDQQEPANANDADADSPQNVPQTRDPNNRDANNKDQEVKPGRDADRDRRTGSIGSNAGSEEQQEDREQDSPSSYQSQLQRALQEHPNLSGVRVAYTDAAVELTGTVPTGKDKSQARMIAHDYANGRRIVDNIKVTGKGK